MRRLERIPEVLGELEEIWKKYPDLRLTQLLENLVTGPIQLYNIEDDQLISMLGKFYKVKVKKIKVFEKGKYHW